jgi:hypothetical protein
MMESTSTDTRRPTPEEIRARAYEIYVTRDGQPGDPQRDWLQAEQELMARASTPRQGIQAFDGIAAPPAPPAASRSTRTASAGRASKAPEVVVNAPAVRSAGDSGGSARESRARKPAR